MMEHWINIRDIRRGQVFWESGDGQDALFVASSDAKRVDQGVEVQAREIPTGKPQRFFEHDRGAAYGPRLYHLPQYTRPDWPALLVGLAALAHADALEAVLERGKQECEAGARLVEQINARSAVEKQNWQLTKERDALQIKLDQVACICGENLNGITMGRRILAVLEG